MVSAIIQKSDNYLDIDHTAYIINIVDGRYPTDHHKS